MSGIAEILLNMGYKISGSDISRSDITQRLTKLGAKIMFEHKPDNVIGSDVVVISSAINKTNPEVQQAEYLKIPVIPRAEMLAELTRIKYTISVAGTHGKTSTTSMAGLILQTGKLDPTIIVGGKLRNLGISTGAKPGKGQFLVAEADESDGSFLKLISTICIVTNIDNDHMDYYKTIKNLRNSFIQFLNKVPFYGCGIICSDDPGVRAILPHLNRKYYTYGLKNNPDITATNIKTAGWGSKFDVVFNKKLIGEFDLKVPGTHNILNALSAICTGIELEIPVPRIQEGLKQFTGVGRRLEIRNNKNNVLYLDDYGHHPTEIKSTLSAIKTNLPDRRLIVIFQPHRYSRTKLLYKQFGPVFKSADIVRLMDIYPAGEKPIPGVTSKLILNEIKKYHGNASMFGEKDINELKKFIRQGDVVLTLGAGSVYKLHDKLC